MRHFYIGKHSPSGEKRNLFQVDSRKENRREKKRMIIEARKNARRIHRQNLLKWFKNPFKNKMPHDGSHAVAKIFAVVALLILITFAMIDVGSKINYHRDAPAADSTYTTGSESYVQKKKPAKKNKIHKIYRNKKSVQSRKKMMKAKARAKARRLALKRKIAKKKQQARRRAEARSKIAQQKFNADLSRISKQNNSGKKARRKTIRPKTRKRRRIYRSSKSLIRNREVRTRMIRSNRY